MGLVQLYFKKIKFFKFTTLCLLYRAWGAKTTCGEWKGGRWNKKAWETLA